MTSTQQASGLAIADREEEIDEWLKAHGVQNAPAGELAGAGVTNAALDRLANLLEREKLDVSLRWIAAEYSAQSLSADIERAAVRIQSLVASVKGFTHMDRARDEGPVDIPSGLSDTVEILKGKARRKSVTINLSISSPANGHVNVSATYEGPAVVVRVKDDGPGIPPEIKGNIFDPFFTTKGAGEGTGLGLDIVRRIVTWHNGQVDVETEPGRTEFVVRLPCSAAAGSRGTDNS